MNISKNKLGQIELKTKKATTVFTDKLTINGIELEGAGEYEIGEVSVEGIEDNLYIFNVEDLAIGLLDFKEKISKEQAETLSNADVLIVRVNGNFKEAAEQVNQIEPKMSIYLGSADSLSQMEKDGFTPEKTEQIKFTKNDVEIEGKSYFIELTSGESI